MITKPFPPRPGTEDEWCTQLLDLMSVERHPNVFLVGSFAKYVTIYAQQVRALNLVAALARNGRFSARSRVGVIGGGIAGLTAAAAAAFAGAGRVSVFEREPSLMRLQRNCEKRFVHPHIYDWPSPGAMDKTAGLPFMNWEASTAADVVGQLEKAWSDVRVGAGERLADPLCDVAEISVTRDAPTPTLVIDGVLHQFDVLLLAVGYGIEQPTFGLSYWSDDDLGAPEHETRDDRWLVSGIGDGALTDLMRLCIRDFTHARVLEAVHEKTRNTVGNDLLKADAGGTGHEDAFREAAKQVDSDLRKTIGFRSIGKVWLNDRSNQLFEPYSSILNRLITAWLLLNDRFERFAGDLQGSERHKDSSEIDVRFKDKPPMTVDHLIERHGPKRPLDHQPWLEDIAAGADSRRLVWQGALKQDDWTRVPNYDVVFGPGPKPSSSRLRVDFGDDIGCVVVTGHGEITDPDLAYRVEQALGRLRDAKGTERYAPGRKLAITPEHLRLEEVLSSPDLYERAIRALCTSEIAVFDLTGYQSPIMLLLGLRSAVRRGVTVVVTQDERPALPFNVASLNPVQADGDLVGDLAKALESAFAAMLAVGTRYLDLPAYDPVRALGDDYRIRGPEVEILILRWFDEQYGDRVGNQIVRSHLVDAFGEAAKIITVLDSRSPQLVEQRLYASIRRTRLCVVDCTARRPSVFFEAGVRLAVNEHQPIFIHCETKPKKWLSDKAHAPWPEDSDPWLPALEKLFGLTRFSPGNPAPLKARIAAYKKDPVLSARGAWLSPGRTYAVVSEAIDRAIEPGGAPVQSILLSQADLLAGPGLDEGDVPVLYGNVLKEQVRRAAVEHTLAAWYYQLGRHKILDRMAKNDIEKGDTTLQELEQIGSRLSARVRNASEEFREFRTEVLQVLKQIQDYRGQPTTDVIARARALKSLAMDERDVGNWVQALKLLGEAREALSQAVNELSAQPGEKDTKLLEFETSVNKQLYGLLGSIGGVYRRRAASTSAEPKDLISAIESYRAGWDVERQFTDSYNLTQGLVTRVLLHPSSAITESEIVEGVDVRKALRQAKAIIAEQTSENGPRNKDEYAYADAAVISTMLGDPRWIDAINEFTRRAPRSSYARAVTIDLLKELAARVKPGDPATESLSERIHEALRMAST